MPIPQNRLAGLIAANIGAKSKKREASWGRRDDRQGEGEDLEPKGRGYTEGEGPRTHEDKVKEAKRRLALLQDKPEDSSYGGVPKPDGHTPTAANTEDESADRETVGKQRFLVPGYARGGIVQDKANASEHTGREPMGSKSIEQGQDLPPRGGDKLANAVARMKREVGVTHGTIGYGQDLEPRGGEISAGQVTDVDPTDQSGSITEEEGGDLQPYGDVKVKRYARGGEVSLESEGADAGGEVDGDDGSDGGTNAAAQDILHSLKRGDAAGLASALGAFLDCYQPADE
jgi:hypothetical protein